MSTVKSGQQLFGSFIRMLSLNTKVVTIMPCYDKKLEAVRPDFKFTQVETTPVKEVDTVLATHELVDLFDKLGYDFVSEKYSCEEAIVGESDSLMG